MELSTAVLQRDEQIRDEQITEETIAAMSADTIQCHLTKKQMISIICGVEYPFAGKDRIESFDRDTLERVVYLIRRWCRQRLQSNVW